MKQAKMKMCLTACFLSCCAVMQLAVHLAIINVYASDGMYKIVPWFSLDDYSHKKSRTRCPHRPEILCSSQTLASLYP